MQQQQQQQQTTKMLTMQWSNVFMWWVAGRPLSDRTERWNLQDKFVTPQQLHRRSLSTDLVMKKAEQPNSAAYRLPSLSDAERYENRFM